jgi:hypothetical protein
LLNEPLRGNGTSLLWLANACVILSNPTRGIRIVSKVFKNDRKDVVGTILETLGLGSGHKYLGMSEMMRQFYDRNERLISVKDHELMCLVSEAQQLKAQQIQNHAFVAPNVTRDLHDRIEAHKQWSEVLNALLKLTEMALEFDTSNAQVARREAETISEMQYKPFSRLPQAQAMQRFAPKNPDTFDPRAPDPLERVYKADVARRKNLAEGKPKKRAGFSTVQSNTDALTRQKDQLPLRLRQLPLGEKRSDQVNKYEVSKARLLKPTAADELSQCRQAADEMRRQRNAALALVTKAQADAAVAANATGLDEQQKGGRAKGLAKPKVKARPKVKAKVKAKVKVKAKAKARSVSS